MTKTAKLTVSVPRELIKLADQVARERKVSRSKVVSACLQELSEKQKAKTMAEGYKAMYEEQTQLAAIALKAESEIVPDWK